MANIPNETLGGRSRWQAVYALHKDGYTASKLLSWIKRNGLQPIKRVHYIGDSIRYRLKIPNSNKKYVTKVLSNGIHLVIEV